MLGTIFNLEALARKPRSTKEGLRQRKDEAMRT